MANKRDYVEDEGESGKYFHVMLNMADDDLDPYQYRLLGHYKRVCGKKGACWESTRTTAKITRMSVGKVSKTRLELESLGYIHMEERANDTLRITMIDRMADNVARYVERSPDEQGVHEVNTAFTPRTRRSRGEQGVHEVKQRITNEEEPSQEPIKEQPQTEVAAAETPTFDIFRLYQKSYNFLVNPTIKDELLDLEKTYPQSWLEDAFKKAALAHAKSLKYVIKILEAWSRNGKNDTAEEQDSQQQVETPQEPIEELVFPDGKRPDFSV
jgi:hypothetical protein